jgi:hypothetical protein
LEKLPDDGTVKDIPYHLSVVEKVHRGIENLCLLKWRLLELAIPRGFATRLPLRSPLWKRGLGGFEI